MSGPLNPVHAADREEQIAARMLAMCYARLRASVAMSAAVATLFAGVLLPLIELQSLLGWYAVLLGVAGLRFVLWRQHEQTPPEQRETRVWALRLFGGAVLAGLSWSSGMLFVLPAVDSPTAIILFVSVIAVSAVASNSLSAHLASCAGFIIAAIGPIAVSVLTRSKGVELIVGLALVGAIVALLLTAYGSWTTTRRLVAGELDLAQTLAEAADARLAAERANNAKSVFLATMSHEIRTPLNGVLGLASLLDCDELDPANRERARLLRRSGEELLEIVNDILDFSKIEAEQMQLVQRDFEPRVLVDETAGVWGSRARAGGLEFRVEVAAEVPALAQGDSLRLRQVLGNLVSNAIKFTECGSIEVRLGVAGDALRFEVRDTGIGIEGNSLGAVFQPFTQVDDSYTRRAGGTGLGLAISRRLVELMGGRIGVSSERRVGSTFWFEIPLPVATAATTVAATQRQRAAAAGSPYPDAAPAMLSAPAADALLGPRAARVLVVEDNAINRTVAGAMLERLGIVPEFAEDGRVALQRVRSDSFDLILMDCQMPVLDGYQTTIQLRRMATLARSGAPIPILALTANAFDEDRRRAAEAGMDGFLAKPLQLSTLKAALDPWLARATAPVATPGAGHANVPVAPGADTIHAA